MRRGPNCCPCKSHGYGVNDAVHARFWFIVTSHGLVVPVQPQVASLQPSNVPVVVTVSLTGETPNADEHVPVEQLIPAGVLVTVPVPLMLTSMVAW